MKRFKILMTGVAAFTTATMAFAADFELPSQVTWSAYDTGSAGYNQAIAVGAALQNSSGVSLRVLPGKNDVSRLQPVRQGKVGFSATGLSGAFMAQEGVYEFSDKNWGPQPIRMVMANNFKDTNVGLAVAGDLNITEYSELKGKRVSWIVGAPALNITTTAILAYGGLTWDDVEKVEFGGYGDAWRGLMGGTVDTIFTTTNAGLAYEAAAGPRSIAWPRIDPDNAEGIARMQAVVPFLKPNRAIAGANIDGTDGVDGATYSYPVLVTYENYDEDVVYNMVKAMNELYADYKDAAPGAAGWDLALQDMQIEVPYHEGAIRFYKEKGMWSDEDQVHNDALLDRQDILMSAWEQMQAETPDTNWVDVRNKALTDAGLTVVFGEAIE